MFDISLYEKINDFKLIKLHSDFDIFLRPESFILLKPKLIYVNWTEIEISQYKEMHDFSVIRQSAKYIVNN